MNKLIALGIGLIIAPASALADTQQNCLQYKDRNLKIQACTQIIVGNPRDATAYYERAMGYSMLSNLPEVKDDTDRMVADLNEAIKLNPKFVDAYDGRIRALRSKGEYESAIADYKFILELNPKEAGGYYVNRGEIRRAMGDYEAALADTDRGIRLLPNDDWFTPYAHYSRGLVNFYKTDYGAASLVFKHSLQRSPGYHLPALWLYLARVRMSSPIPGSPTALAELATNATKLKKDDWRYPVIEMFLGYRTPEAILATATKAYERCGAQFYVGEWYLLRGERAAAADVLKTLADSCSIRILEYREHAQLERKRFGL